MPTRVDYSDGGKATTQALPYPAQTYKQARSIARAEDASYNHSALWLATGTHFGPVYA